MREVAADVVGEGPTVVLLHGQPGDRHDWDAVVAELAGVQAIVPDRPGYGETGGTAGGFADNAAAIVSLLDRYAVDRAVVVGHSWGGGAALAMARDHPDRVGGLVLVASIGGPGSVGVLDHFLAARVVGPVLALAGFAALRATRVRRLLGPVHAPADPHAVDVLPADWFGSWRSFVAEERLMLRELPALAASLPAIDVPATVLIGAADRVVAPSSQEALAGALPRATVVRLPGHGHLLPREAPAEVARAIHAAANSGCDDPVP